VTEFERGVAAVVEWLRGRNFRTIAGAVELAFTIKEMQSSEKTSTTLPRPETVKAYVEAKAAYEKARDEAKYGRESQAEVDTRARKWQAAVRLADEVCQ
jgi:hypothetical protein